MRLWLGMILLLAVSVVARCAQQGSGASGAAPAKPQSSAPSGASNSSSTNSSSTNPPSNSSSANSNSSSPGSSSSAQNSPSNTPTSGAPGLASHPPLDSLSTDTTFPGDRPQNAAPAAAEPSAPAPAAPSKPDLTPPRSDSVRASDLGKDVGSSSSKDTQINLDAPDDDAKAHPQSATAVGTAEALAGGDSTVGEFHPWDPHKAAKDVEVGDYYFKLKNYRAAEDRYREALFYKNNDAAATFKLALCLERLGAPGDARAEYESYLKILPHGPEAEKAQQAIARLKAGEAK